MHINTDDMYLCVEYEAWHKILQRTSPTRYQELVKRSRSAVEIRPWASTKVDFTYLSSCGERTNNKHHHFDLLTTINYCVLVLSYYKTLHLFKDFHIPYHAEIKVRLCITSSSYILLDGNNSRNYGKIDTQKLLSNYDFIG